MEKEKLIVNLENAGVRLDAYVADNINNLSRTMVKKRI